MSALISPIDGRSTHHLQSGQVINDGLISAVKELVENALDAHATSIEIRFKSYGLESLEVIDNGDGISAENYESIALKHHTSKLRTFEDLESVTTFGFRGEALSSLCALADFHIVTATASEAPKGNKLEFEMSGKLKSNTMVAASKGTTVCVGNLYKSLPVRRMELERNIRREYSKVLGMLQAYASICVGVKFSVFNQPPKGKRSPVFATKGNPTTRENISNVFGSKTLAALVQLDLQFELRPTKKRFLTQPAEQSPDREVKIVGHISRPVVGEGRSAPDRQMFFVNGRPCVLPQISKAFNEVYRGFNVTQSPFIFADLLLDTHSYDVNVSPDKRTVLLHDQADLLENLKSSLTELFENHEQTIPISQIGATPKLPSYKQANLFSSPAAASLSPLRGHRGQFIRAGEDSDIPSSPIPASRSRTPHLDEDMDIVEPVLQKPTQRSKETPKYDLSTGLSRFAKNAPLPFKVPGTFTGDEATDEVLTNIESDSLEPEAEPAEDLSMEDEIPSTKPPANSCPPPKSRMPKRRDAFATITIGDRTPVTTGTVPGEYPRKKRRVEDERSKEDEVKPDGFVSALSKFLAPGTQTSEDDEPREEDDVLGKEDDEPREQDDSLPEYDMDTAEQEDAGGEGFEGEHNAKTPVDDKLDDRPLFLPRPYRDEDSESEEDRDDDEEEEEEEDIPLNRSPSPEPPEREDDDDDEEYVPEAEAEAEKRAAARAARLLKEAEEYEVTRPIEQLLERNLRLFDDSRTITTTTLIQTEKTSLEQIQVMAQQYCKASLPRFTAPVDSGPNKGFSSQDDEAEERLNLTVSKEDFFKMRIHGQFNKGFILATRDNELFIIDQHASDEKYNFETLQATTVVQNQPLVVPRVLDLTAMDEITVIDNLDIFKKNGFIVEVDPEMPTGRRCKLKSLPMSRETVFGVAGLDLEELIHLIHQHEGSGMEHLRCSKVRSMFAMRACRKSVMVGKALPIKEMEKIVRHMGELDKPWNCPHGRPTMRHLAQLDYIERWTEKDESRGGGGLQWDSEEWKGLLEMYGQEERSSTR
ncbi:DNA mismatch repair protein MutL [Wilcoxina mikolae CBS 423.85]|nr:DNA mismatch repair protein MutL [Wilcoxina mikolae CBS 423.85]